MKKYWRSLDEIETGPVEHKDSTKESENKDGIAGLLEGIPFNSGASRRDFLKLLSYSVASAAILSACKKPIQHAVPFLTQPTNIVPGVASHYASTFFDGSEFCPVVVKVRDGRPIKLEGNNLYNYTKGGTSPRVQASILSLYDNARIKFPVKKQNQMPWEQADSEIIESLTKIAQQNRQIVLLTSTIFSPSTISVLEEFRHKYPSFKTVNYDVVSYSGIVDAYNNVMGIKAIPYPLFNKADVIVSFGADFLGTWLLPTEFTLAYVQKRKLEDEKSQMSRHIQYESNLSLTGSNADERVTIKPSDEINVVAALYNLIASKTGAQPVNAEKVPDNINIEKLAAELLGKKGKSIVISGSNDERIQKLIIAINQLLDNYGSTFDVEKPVLIKQGSDSEMFALIEDMKEGKVGAIFFNNTNPYYDYFDPESFATALEKVDLKVSFSAFPNETLQLCDYICPDFNFLESWNDFEPRPGIYTISQPCIHNIFDTRQMPQSFLVWMGKSDNWFDYIKNYWQKNIFHDAEQDNNFETFWITLLKNGCFETNKKESLQFLNTQYLNNDKFNNSDNNDQLELLLTVPIGLSSQYHSNNPWLQELPDPITRATWDNYASISPKLAGERGIETGDIIKIEDLEIPALVQPGQAYGVISIALNYGRNNNGKVAEDVGVNVYQYALRKNYGIRYFRKIENFTRTGKSVTLALTQTHHTMEGRDIVRETTLSEYKNKAGAGNEAHEIFENEHQTLYPEHNHESFLWGLGVDLNSCIGCGACTIACQVENNVAVVGKEQVTKRRIMHWIRIDRYYSGPPETPSVLFQPLTCQHCENAPCENVCPVGATNHSNEGLNQMAYNRCVGTRYCINNCPYKVRRFNWFKFTDNPKFDFNQNSNLGKMVLNPDVVVRERGVVEKCTFCIQRIQDKKLTAKLENRAIHDGEVQPACVQACPAEALTFGDLNNKHSNIFKLYKNKRNYHLLEELHTLPKVGYLTKVRNTEAI